MWVSEQAAPESAHPEVSAESDSEELLFGGDGSEHVGALHVTNASAQGFRVLLASGARRGRVNTQPRIGPAS